jgi:hypothetical protein
MAEDTTRRLLKVFGVSMTDCEDAVAALTVALSAGEPAAARSALEAYGKAARDLATRWAEVSRLVFDYQQRAQAAIEAHLGSASGR